MSTSYERDFFDDWVAFFENAGIPSETAETYAALFVENRIRGDMLADLHKGILRDMGITAQGTHTYMPSTMGGGEGSTKSRFDKG